MLARQVSTVRCCPPRTPELHRCRQCKVRNCAISISTSGLRLIDVCKPAQTMPRSSSWRLNKSASSVPPPSIAVYPAFLTLSRINSASFCIVYFGPKTIKCPPSLGSAIIFLSQRPFFIRRNTDYPIHHQVESGSILTPKDKLLPNPCLCRYVIVNADSRRRYGNRNGPSHRCILGLPPSVHSQKAWWIYYGFSASRQWSIFEIDLQGNRM